MNDHIKISESETNLDNKLKKIADSTQTLIDSEKKIFVNFGIPTNEHKAIIVPDNPHIFIIDILNIKDMSHPQGVKIKNPTVLMAHGTRDQNNDWIFVNGQSVKDTVYTYNDHYSKKEGLPPIEFLAVCNSDPTINGTGIQISEFGPRNVIAHASAESIDAYGIVEENFPNNLNIESKENIIHLDDLITLKEIVVY